MHVFASQSVVLYTRVAVFALVALFLVPSMASADTVVRTTDRVTVDADQEVEGNFYSIGDTINVSGDVTGDWFALGNSVTGNGTFAKDVLILSRSADVHGSTTDDVRIVALETTLTEAVGGSATIVANTVTIPSTATIAGDVLLFANQVEIHGTVEGDILGRANTIRIDGTVGGSVDIHTEQLTLGERADIAGDVYYESPNDIVRAQDSVIGGETQKTEVSTEVSFRDTAEQLLMPYLAIMFISLLLFLLLPQTMIRVVSYTKGRLSLALLTGFAVLLTGPILAILFLLSGLGFLVGVFIIALYLVVLLFGLAVSGPLFGSLLGQWIMKRQQVDVISIIVGVTVAHVLLLVPIFGLGLFLALVFAGTGGAFLLLYRYRA